MEELYQDCTRKGPLWSGLRSRGYVLKEFTLSGKPFIRCTAPNGKTWLTSTNVSYPMVSDAARIVAEHKDIAYALVEKLGGNIPVTKVITPKNEHELTNSIFDTLRTVVVKPTDSFGSQGVTCNVTELSQLSSAIVTARQYSDDVIAQEQVDGEEMRVTVLNGKAISVLQRLAPRVIGDGTSTVAELIRRENEFRRSLRLEYVAYPPLTADVIDERYINDERTILASDEVLTMGAGIRMYQGGIIHEILSGTHKSYIELAQQLAAPLCANVVVVDMFVKDYTIQSASGNWWFNEFNMSPSIGLYYASRNGETSHDAANAILDMLDKAVQGRQ